MTINVLFLCPHSAGKSLAAATYFRAAANQAGLQVTISVAGTDPDAANMPNVVEALTTQGHTIDWSPKLVDAADTSNADLVVNIGCDIGSIPTDKTLIDWDVPLLSNNFTASLQAIDDHTKALTRQLATN